MKVYFPERIVGRHVGGNTTYALKVRDGLTELGVETGLIPSGGSAVRTMLSETRFGRDTSVEGVLHYSADTGPLVKTRVPSIVTVHGVASRWTRVARSNAQEYIWRTRVARAIASTDRLITVSHSAADDIAEVFGVDRATIDVIHHGIDTTQFAGHAQLSDELAATLPPEFFLYLGNVEPRKNLVSLVRAFQQPELRDLGIPLVIAGRAAWNFEDSLAAIEAVDNVHYLGFVSDDDRRALMQKATAFLFPSLYEGFGFPVLEALSAGTPAISSSKGSLAEVAGPAWVIDDLEPAGIAAAVVEAVGDSAWMARVRVEGPEWVERFKWSDSVNAHLDVYKKVANA
ncbi:glycosyltransferase family 4 protein [Agromyces atrinae]|uniref:glycosyltransferase family 4 protein n=1 Tax=Agromyces atrinae TaxID=592376 RepID=UPI001F575B80|nr:glycosyltransferase family 1 protein [Agromyces atrinae]MCI2956081.1 glycosyltransferase family 4 protein [Agromyces atrinae]